MEYLTVAKTADLKGCSERYIKKLCKDGKLSCNIEINDRNRPKYMIPISSETGSVTGINTPERKPKWISFTSASVSSSIMISKCRWIYYTASMQPTEIIICRGFVKIEAEPIRVRAVSHRSCGSSFAISIFPKTNLPFRVVTTLRLNVQKSGIRQWYQTSRQTILSGGI